MDQNLEKKNHYNFLYPYYQMLLTQKQQDVFEDYYFNDYSLSEIAESFDVSRNAIWDILKKVERNLDDYEEKLGLFKKNQALNKALDELVIYTNEKGKEIINKIKEME